MLAMEWAVSAEVPRVVSGLVGVASSSLVTWVLFIISVGCAVVRVVPSLVADVP